MKERSQVSTNKENSIGRVGGYNLTVACGVKHNRGLGCSLTEIFSRHIDIACSVVRAKKKQSNFQELLNSQFFTLNNRTIIVHHTHVHISVPVHGKPLTC